MTPKSKYIRELRKFWFKKLAHIKKPRERKRKIVDRYAFATAIRHKSNGVQTRTGGLEVTGVVFDDFTQFNEQQMKTIRERAAILNTPFVVFTIEPDDRDKLLLGKWVETEPEP